MRIRLHTLIPIMGMCLALMTLFGLAADSPSVVSAGPDYPHLDRAKATSWDVVRVVGADRLIIRNAAKQRTVKLLGVAEPETEWPKAVSPANHLLAVEFLSNLLAGEEILVLETASQPVGSDAVAEVKLFRAPDGLYVNLEMVRQGYAKLSPTGLEKELDLFRAYQERARLTGKGIWNKSLAVTPAVEETGGAIVYVTKTGKKYHRQNCQFLSKSKVAIGLDEAKKRGFTPCRICKPQQ